MTNQLKTTEQLALPAREVAKLLGISERLVWTMHATGQIPRPVRLRRCSRWNRSELVAWLEAGCPSRGSWEDQRRGQRGGDRRG